MRPSCLTRVNRFAVKNADEVKPVDRNQVRAMWRILYLMRPMRTQFRSCAVCRRDSFPWVAILEEAAVRSAASSDLTSLGQDVTTKSISDRAEVALEYPDKFYSGTFERSSRFEASMDRTGLALVLEHPGSEDVRKSVHVHINYGLLSDILQQLRSQVSKIPPDEIHLDQLRRTASEFSSALQAG